MTSGVNRRRGNGHDFERNAVISEADMQALRQAPRPADYGEFKRFPVFSGKTQA